MQNRHLSLSELEQKLTDYVEDCNTNANKESTKQALFLKELGEQAEIQENKLSHISDETTIRSVIQKLVSDVQETVLWDQVCRLG